MLASYFQEIFVSKHTFSILDPKVVKLYGGAQGPVHFQRVQCLGNETNLLECSKVHYHFRGPGSILGADAGVSCGTVK